MLARRFEKYFELLQSVHVQLQVSRLAEELGYENVEFLDQLRRGIRYFSLFEIEDFCNRAGLNAQWFEHGDGKPFEPSIVCYSDLSEILNELPETKEWWFYFVRSSCQRGRVCFVRQDNAFVFRVYDTLLHLSEENGGEGARNLLIFYFLLTEINSMWIGRTISYTLPEEEFERLINGECLPSFAFRNQLNCYWAHDFPLVDQNEPSSPISDLHGREFEAAQKIVKVQLKREVEYLPERIKRIRDRNEALGDGTYGACPVCESLRSWRQTEDAADSNRRAVECPRCGHFYLGTEVSNRITAAKIPRLQLSAWIRAYDESDGIQPTIRVNQLDQIVASFPKLSLEGKLHLLITVIAGRTKPSESTILTLENDFVLAWAESASELRFLLDALNDQGLIEVEYAFENATCGLTLAGWEHFEAWNPSNRNYAQVFVAMSFDPELDSAWHDGIEPAVRSEGYEPYRVDKDQHLGRIDAKIHTEIDRSKFVIADVTLQKPGVYFEAGYALGQQIPVVWCVRNDEVEKLHFDTRQYNHVIWDNPADLFAKLSKRISDAIGET